MAKSRTTNAAVTIAAAGRSGTSRPQQAPVSNRDVARRAYDRYLARGREDGHDVDDWLQAERELRSDPEC